MTDKNSKNTLPHFNVDPSNEPQLEMGNPGEEEEVNPNVLLGGLLSRSPENECQPECKASRNERCQKLNGVMRCVCRPGFARMFAERPCKPTYTFSMQVPLERVGEEKIRFTNGLMDASTSVYQHLAEATKEGLDRMVMQSDLRDVYHGLSVTGFGKNNNNVNDTMAKFYIQLSENTDETKLEEVFRKHLKTNNFSMGGTELHASKEKLEFLQADDFDECVDTKFHDCSENAQCFNLRGTYTCSCREGFTDLSHNTLYPGRICSAEMIGCERCNFHGNCFPRESEEDLCECFQWYAGQYCQINLKVLLLILSLVGISLVVLLVVCLVLSCMRRRPLGVRGVSASQLRPPGFRLRPHQPQDKRAMISLDTSSEASMDHTPPPYIKQAASLQSQVARPQKPCRKMSKAPSPPLSYHGTMEQRDRSLTVMIPRAKYRPVPAPGSNLTMSTFGPEQKLLKYLTVEKPQNSRSNSRKPSNSTTNSQETAAPKKLSHAQAPPPRKPSTGALVSAGFEVSATVGRTKEIQECFISEPHTDLNINQGGFSTIRTADSSVLVDVPPPPTLEAELLDSSRVDFLTVSEARSYDETLIHPPTKSLRSNYDRNSEGHTMVERDTGSTFVLPQSQLYRPDRGNGSDISNFDSL
uniref:63 kDa sperm flagellar membrane protein n=1 Tax=Lygus hesperus TaxID=30085 RepID=A0A0A9Z5Z8_LYGHE